MIALETESVFGVKVPNFEGPLDLLLHLIHENKVNIYDIPIAQITRQYLDALKWMRSLNLNIAGDFLVMAATLILMKSRTLLPASETPADETEEEGEDPRQALALRLLEYQKFKEAAGELTFRESVWRQIFFRQPSDAPVVTPDDIFLGDLTSYDLLNALQKVIARLPDQAGWTIETDDLSVQDQICFILSKIERTRTLLFDQLFEGIQTRMAVVVTFLALLEMVRIGLIQVVQTQMCGPLRLIGAPNLVAENEEEEGENDGGS